MTKITYDDYADRVRTYPYFQEPLVTDWLAWEVIARTPKTVTLRRMAPGDIAAEDPMVRTSWSAVPDPGGEVVLLRIRKDGTVRRGPGLRAMRPVQVPTISRYWLD